MSLQLNVREALSLVVPRLREQLESHAVHPHGDTNSLTHRPPVLLGLTGLQGSGKSTWATSIVNSLKTDFGLRAIQVSLDDFYLTHEALVQVRESDITNSLFRTRGQPGTHDEELATAFFEECRRNEGVLRIPAFDKSKFNGEGDRAAHDLWPTVSGEVDVVVFEGWCIGFQPIPQLRIREKQLAAVATRADLEEDVSNKNINTLADHKLEHLVQVNANLERYCQTFMDPKRFHCLVHLDTDNIGNVYIWRLQQEHALRQKFGSGLKDEQVEDFVRGYMPAYELYLDQLRGGFFAQVEDRKDSKVQLNVLLGRNREVLRFQQV